MVGWRYIRFVTLGGGSLLKRFSRLPPPSVTKRLLGPRSLHPPSCQ
eukprot:COSAG05_NODE_27375_length_156_cov_46.456140_1_plen_45_part_01